MNPRRWRKAAILWLGALLAAPPGASAQQVPREPHLGYIYPAGGQQGTTFELTVGGQYLTGASDVLVSGDGVRVTVGKYARPLNPVEVNRMRDKLQEAQKRMQADRAFGGLRDPRRDFEAFRKVAHEAGLSDEDLKALEDFRKRMTDPKRQLNAQIAETVALQVELAPDARPGVRELRLLTPVGLSNPLRFHVGQFPEVCEHEPNEKLADIGIGEQLPIVVNGQILPGDVDRFSFQARKGQRLVVVAEARELVPYLADAVPGWFQATLAIYDSEGNEVAFDDDFRFDPDPVLYCEIPKDDRYVLETRDAIYRGRDDFVYRITLGELPFVTSIFPLGGRKGERTTVQLKGWNLPIDKVTLKPEDVQPGVHPLPVQEDRRIFNGLSLAVDTLPECLEKEPNNEEQAAQEVALPVIVNGRIQKSGDWDVFRFDGRAGDQIVAEVYARRLNSPLDSLVELTDASGRQLVANDDHEDKGAGLTTHHADSRLSATLPADGTYYLHLGDAQHKGGGDYGYRFHIGRPRPDFELRVVPSSISARPGASVPITVYALRQDGFSGEIALRLKDPPPGCSLSGGLVPAGQDQVRLTLSVSYLAPESPFSLHLEGHARIRGRDVTGPAVAAEDMMQAFIYRHLVPAEDLMVAVIGRGWPRGLTSTRIVGEGRVRLPAGRPTQVRFSLPSGPFLDRVRLALNEPPEGITIDNVSPTRDGVAVLLRADRGKVKPGLKGNLIVDAYVERPADRQGGPPQAGNRRIPLGTLPAIPFEIVRP